MDPRAGAAASGCFRIDPGQLAVAERAFFCWVKLKLNHDQASAHCGQNQDVIEVAIYSYSTGLINP